MPFLHLNYYGTLVKFLVLLMLQIQMGQYIYKGLFFKYELQSTGLYEYIHTHTHYIYIHIYVCIKHHINLVKQEIFEKQYKKLSSLFREKYRLVKKTFWSTLAFCQHPFSTPIVQKTCALSLIAYILEKSTETHTKLYNYQLDTNQFSIKGLMMCQGELVFSVS